jgi:hypothetical protein
MSLSYFTARLSDIYKLGTQFPLRLVLYRRQTVNYNMVHTVLGKDHLIQTTFINPTAAYCIGTSSLCWQDEN